MSDHSEKVKCPDCSMKISSKNIQKHYRKMHPGLDPVKRMREAREQVKRRSHLSHFETRKPMIIGLVLILAVTTVFIIASLLVYSILHDGGDAAPPERNIFYSASDGAAINGTWYAASEPGAETVFLIHDIGKDRTVWNDYAVHLRSDGYNVLAIDLRGHGGSVHNIKSADITYDWTTMTHSDLLLIQNDIQGALDWVHGVDDKGKPNTEAGKYSSFIGVGKGGLYAMNTFSRLSREGVLSGAIISPTLDCYSLDVMQVFEDWGDVRPIMLAAGEGDGTAEIAVDMILERKEQDEEKNGEGVFVPGSARGMDLLKNKEFVTHLDEFLIEGWETTPTS
ncbi:MAG: hypothetical protein JXA22_06830 [Candidatus Thermoplasmatota archaeon]|nr:hypothetical protein [Candidatus Thermoplasmatota archaeon]